MRSRIGERHYRMQISSDVAARPPPIRQTGAQSLRGSPRLPKFLPFGQMFRHLCRRQSRPYQVLADKPEVSDTKLLDDLTQFWLNMVGFIGRIDHA